MLHRFAIAIALLFTAVCPAAAGPVASLNDITTWVGTGPNRAALVVDGTPAGGSSLVWGYRWDGTATGEDMLRAVAAADVGLYLTIGEFSFGNAVLGFGVDVDRDGVFGVTPALTFVDGVATLVGGANADPARAATDPGDFYREDFFSGYWGYWLKANDAAPWEEAQTGPTDRALSGGVWDGYGFAPNFAALPPAEPSNPASGAAAVPAPGGLALVAAAGPALLVVRRRRRAGG